ncbi:MAG TPA: metalloregulator ArsR/SmtB family transcription factor [Patescibacteria group bacterium]
MYAQLFDLHADLFKALAHPRRLEIIQLLRDQKLCVSDIHTMLDLPQANISQHLMILRDAGIVRTTRDGKQIFYQVADIKCLQACDLIREMLIDQHQELRTADEILLDMKALVPLTTDPVCGMRLSPKTAGFAHIYNQEAYYFCASGCEKAFKERPEKYVS